MTSATANFAVADCCVFIGHAAVRGHSGSPQATTPGFMGPDRNREAFSRICSYRFPLVASGE